VENLKKEEAELIKRFKQHELIWGKAPVIKVVMYEANAVLRMSEILEEKIQLVYTYRPFSKLFIIER
jgi:hypothetical protein